MNEFIKSNLQDGEVYAGVILGQNGEKDYHLFLRPEKHETELSWDDAMGWAKSIGYDLPTRQEQSLLFANCRDKFDLNDWYWSSEHNPYSYEYAWIKSFYYGEQYGNPKSKMYCARAVRRLYETE